MATAGPPWTTGVQEIVEFRWVDLAASEPGRSYLALLSYLPLRRFRSVPAFLRFSRAIREQLAGTAGVLGYSMRAKILRREFWTLSAWEGEAALLQFVRTAPHRDAMAALAPHMGETRFVRWEVPGSALPLAWEDALARAAKG